MFGSGSELPKTNVLVRQKYSNKHVLYQSYRQRRDQTTFWFQNSSKIEMLFFKESSIVFAHFQNIVNMNPSYPISLFYYD